MEYQDAIHASRFNDDPEHEFMLSQVIRSTSPVRKEFSTEDSLFEYTARRRPAFRENKSDEIHLSVSSSLKRTSSVSSDQSVRETFELQLNKLQNDLEASMIENSKLRDKLVSERSRASTRFDLPSDAGSNVTAQTVEVKSGDISFENIVCEQTIKARKTKEEEGKIRKAKHAYKKYTERLNIWLWDFLSNFHVEDNEDSGEEQKVETFAPSILSENIGRLTKAAKPYSKGVEKINKTLHWDKRAETLVIFLLYMISAYTGYTLQVLLIFMIWRMSVSYIIATGLANRFSIFSDEEQEEVKEEEKNWVDKVAMARVILLKVQTITGGIADALEKINNLLTWRIPEVTMKLYRFLWIALIASMILPTSFQLKLMGVLMGVKMFIISPVYKKYPKAKERYDSIGKLWSILPTNEGLNLIANRQVSVSSESGELDSGEIRNSPQKEAKERHVLTKFSLTTKEKILDGWLTGKRANLMNRGNLLSGYKTGKLYLTTNYICFEKANAASNNDRIKMELSSVQSVSKAKPFQILPGSGMSIEIFMKDEKSYLFAAIFNRDETFKDIIEAGLSRGHEWAIRHEEN